MNRSVIGVVRKKLWVIRSVTRFGEHKMPWREKSYVSSEKSYGLLEVLMDFQKVKCHPPKKLNHCEEKIDDKQKIKCHGAKKLNLPEEKNDDEGNIKCHVAKKVNLPEEKNDDKQKIKCHG